MNNVLEAVQTVMNCKKVYDEIQDRILREQDDSLGGNEFSALIKAQKNAKEMIEAHCKKCVVKVPDEGFYGMFDRKENRFVDDEMNVYELYGGYFRTTNESGKDVISADAEIKRQEEEEKEAKAKRETLVFYKTFGRGSRALTVYVYADGSTSAPGTDYASWTLEAYHEEQERALREEEESHKAEEERNRQEEAERAEEARREAIREKKRAIKAARKNTAPSVPNSPFAVLATLMRK